MPSGNWPSRARPGRCGPVKGNEPVGNVIGTVVVGGCVDGTVDVGEVDWRGRTGNADGCWWNRMPLTV